jgi:hypothetical protein
VPVEAEQREHEDAADDHEPDRALEEVGVERRDVAVEAQQVREGDRRARPARRPTPPAAGCGGGTGERPPSESAGASGDITRATASRRARRHPRAGP